MTSPKYGVYVSFYDARRPKNGGGYIYDCPTDWTRAKNESGVQVAFIQATYGNDPDKGWQVQSAAAQGIVPRCPVHWLYASLDYRQQWTNFRDTVRAAGWTPDEGRLVVDFENQGDDPFEAMDCLCNFQAAASQDYSPETLTIYTYYEYMNDAVNAWKARHPSDTLTWLSRHPLHISYPPRDKNPAYYYSVDDQRVTPDGYARIKSEITSGALMPMNSSGKMMIPYPWNWADVQARGAWQACCVADSIVIAGHPHIKKSTTLEAVYYATGGSIPEPPPTLTLEQRVERLEKMHGL